MKRTLSLKVLPCPVSVLFVKFTVVCSIKWWWADEEDNEDTQQVEEILEMMANQGEITQCKIVPFSCYLYGWMPLCHKTYPLHCNDVTWKQPIKVRNLKPLSLFVSFIALACESVFIKMRSSESRCYRTWKYTVCRHVPASFSPEFYMLRQWRG